MKPRSFSLHARRAVAAAGAAACIAFAAAPALAQPAGYGDRAYYEPGTGEEVQVIAPRRPVDRTTVGAPIEDVALSRPVRTDDLDLRTLWGVRTLRARISNTAHVLCREMDTMYVPLSTNPPCYRTAVRAAWRQARVAIDDAHYAD
ncbi:MAG TPA: UrcA family protein [Rhizomicrobium sp.]|jgi:UrcA family protein